ncbi:MAG TPA: 2-isopropylmalate synthase, partial [Psychromonas hadalis]|nr:2-isopropylmalate synthase [Psychromonas hadalis]
EVGFPISSPGDFQSVQTIAKEIKNSRVCALSRALAKDIDAAGEALRVADQFRIHTFISTSSIHVESKLKRTFDAVLEMAVNAVKHARNYTDDVEFSCEDAGRTPIDDLCRMVEEAIKAGATTINIPDTVGYTIPSEFGGIIETLFNRVPNIDKAIVSVHCHDDLGMSVANSITAVEKGARQIECTINGIGERAGNCSLEEVAMILHTRKSKLGLETNINPVEISRTSQLVSQICNMPIQANKAIVGANAFSHSSGIHQDGVLKAQNTYEIITPESVGLLTNKLNLTSRSGRHVIQHRMQELGYRDEDFNLDDLYESFLELADRKGQVFDYDLEALVFFSQINNEPEHYKLENIDVLSGSGMVATATVRMTINEEKKIVEAATGNGPIDAAFQCLLRISGLDIKMDDYTISAKGAGRDALGQVDIVASYKGQKFHGIGLSTDIIESSARAMVHVMNHIHRAKAVEEEKQKLK